MPGSPGTLPAPDLPTGLRIALVIATASYQDPELRQLRAPAHDADDLADVLGDPHVGGFTVTRVIDQDERQVRREIDAFLSGRGADDTVVVYLSCHGVLDKRNRLYFAAADTVKIRLASTGIGSSWLLDRLEDCRARRQVLILDCCFSGAFAHGGKGEADLDLEGRLVGHGRGRAVLTASRAGEYSFEGQAMPGAAVEGSVFTTGLVKGLRTGAADVGGDGYISLDEAYDYAYSYVKSSGASQTPQIWLYGREGTIVLARSLAGVAITPAPLPDDLATSLDSRYPTVRIGAVRILCEWLTGGDPARALTAEQMLRQIGDTDVPEVAAVARDCLPSPKPTDTTRPSDQGILAAERARQPGPPHTTASSGPQTSAADLFTSSAGSEVPIAATELHTFRESVQRIASVLEVIESAEVTPDVLETQQPFAPQNSTDEGGSVTLGAYLFSIARICRNVVRENAGYLNSMGWNSNDMNIFQLSFEQLVDVWTSYKGAVDDLQFNNSGEKSSSARTVLGTERRRYINAIAAYYVQLSVIMRYLDMAVPD